MPREESMASRQTRRRFLTAGGLLVAGCAALRAAEVAGQKPGPHDESPDPKLGLVTYNLAKDWDIKTILENCRAARFEGVELRTTHAHRVEVGLSPAQRSEVRRQFDDSPVKLMGLGSAFDFHTPDPAQLRRDIEATKEYLVLAHDVGATGVKVRPNALPDQVPIARTLEQIGKVLGELGRFAADLGQQVRLEVHGRGTSLIPNIRTIMDIASHPQVGVCWNSNQTDLEGEGFDANFDLVKQNIFTVHLRDLFLEEYPWRCLIQRLNKSEFRGFYLAEIPESPDPVRVMKYFRALWMSYRLVLEGPA